MQRFSNRVKQEAQEDAKRIINCIDVRRETIRKFKSLADEFDDVDREIGSNNVQSCSIGMVGNGLTTIAGIGTILTGGAALPVLAGLGAIGTVVGVGGSVKSVYDDFKSEAKEKEAKLKESVDKVIKNDNEAMDEFQNVIRDITIKDDQLTLLCMEDRTKSKYSDVVFRELFALIGCYIGLSNICGSDTAFEVVAYTLTSLAVKLDPDVVKCMGVIMHLIPQVQASIILTRNAHEVGEEISKSLGDDIASGFTKSFVQNAAHAKAVCAYEASMAAANEAAKEAAEEAAKEAAKRAAASEVAKKAAKEAAKKGAKAASKKAQKEVLKKAIVGVSKEAIEEFGEQAAKEAAKTAAEEAAKKAGKEAAKKAMKKASEKAAKLAAEEAAKEAAEEVAKKAAEETAKKAAEEAAKKAAKEGAKKAAEEATKTAAKVTGGITAGFGAIGFAYDYYKFTKASEQSKSKSKIGNSLRDLADALEEEIKNMEQLIIVD